MPDIKIFNSIDSFTGKDEWFMYFCAVCDYRHPTRTMNLTNRESWILNSINLTLMKTFKLKSAKQASKIYKLLEDMPEEALMFVMAIVPSAKPKIDKFLKVYKKVQISIKGRELEKLGVKQGLLYKKLLSETLYAKLDKKIKTKKDEIEFVKSRLIAITSGAENN